MNNLSRQLCLYSLTLCASSIALAQTDEFVYVPVLDGGITGSVGALYLVPSSDFESYFAVPSSPSAGETNYDVLNVNPNYQWGIDASLGYIFDDTANAVDLFFRNISTSDTDTSKFDTSPTNTATVTGNLGYDLTAFDLMFSQFVDFGRYMEMRFMAGLAYVELKQNRNTDLENDPTDTFNLSNQTSKFTGWGPRVGIDSRYDFFGGFGLVAGGSFGYYLGKLDTTTYLLTTADTTENATDNQDNHAVMNLRANIALDFMFIYDDKDNSVFGLEAGYLIDYYDDGVGSVNLNGITSAGIAGEPMSTSAVSFSGPYINLKGSY
ncbi:MAG: Lpg1974 family pore-forming outer membrane protein [Gammaproteobacteria bacterium]